MISWQADTISTPAYPLHKPKKKSWQPFTRRSTCQKSISKKLHSHQLKDRSKLVPISHSLKWNTTLVSPCYINGKPTFWIRSRSEMASCTHTKHCTKWQITFSFYVLNYKFVIEVVVWCIQKTRSSWINYYNLNELNSRTRKKKTPFIL